MPCRKPSGWSLVALGVGFPGSDRPEVGQRATAPRGLRRSPRGAETNASPERQRGPGDRQDRFRTPGTPPLLPGEPGGNGPPAVAVGAAERGTRAQEPGTTAEARERPNPCDQAPSGQNSVGRLSRAVRTARESRPTEFCLVAFRPSALAGAPSVVACGTRFAQLLFGKDLLRHFAEQRATLRGSRRGGKWC
jgi:hypothetical protein